MENENEKLRRFINAVNTAADKQVAEILEEAHSEADAIIAAASASAEDARQRSLSDCKKMLSGKYVRMVSKAELDMKKEILLCREELTHRLFENVQGKLNDFRSSSDYEKLMTDSLSQEDSLENAEVLFAPEDGALADKLSEKFGDKTLFATDDTIKFGGYYILRRDKGTVTDKTFDCALKEQQALFASKNLLAGQEG